MKNVVGSVSDRVNRIVTCVRDCVRRILDGVTDGPRGRRQPVPNIRQPTHAHRRYCSRGTRTQHFEVVGGPLDFVSRNFAENKTAAYLYAATSFPGGA